MAWEGWARSWCCKGVGAGSVKAVGSRGGGRARRGNRSDWAEAAGNRDCNRVVVRHRAGSDSHFRWSGRRRGWGNKAGH